MTERKKGASAPYQQLTFTEKEVKEVSAFVQLVYDKAVFNNVTTKECISIPRHFKIMNDHIKKMDENIMEFVRATKAPEKKDDSGKK